RARALLQQLPPQDCDERYCQDLAEEERRQLRAFSARRRREALGQGLACPVPGPCPCWPRKKRRWRKDSFLSLLESPLAEKVPSPFLAQQSIPWVNGFLDGSLVDGSFWVLRERLGCSGTGCFPLQLIFMEECIEAEGRRWHLEHFCCLECEVPLRGQRYVMRSGRPCCCGCFESLFAEPCQACGDPIGADSEEATHQGLHWHARASCFCCSLCRKPLGGQPLTSRRGRLFCSEICSLGRDAASSSSSSSSADSAFASAPSPDS
ncbi:Prickle-like 1, partial [Calypte anna]